MQTHNCGRGVLGLGALPWPEGGSDPAAGWGRRGVRRGSPTQSSGRPGSGRPGQSSQARRVQRRFLLRVPCLSSPQFSVQPPPSPLQPPGKRLCFLRGNKAKERNGELSDEHTRLACGSAAQSGARAAGSQDCSQRRPVRPQSAQSGRRRLSPACVVFARPPLYKHTSQVPACLRGLRPGLARLSSPSWLPCPPSPSPPPPPPPRRDGETSRGPSPEAFGPGQATGKMFAHRSPVGQATVLTSK